MNPQLWKNVLDGLDEDIVNSAAERFGNGRYDDESPESYPADDKPLVYSFPEKKKSRRHLWAGIGAGTAAAAAVVVVVGAALRFRPAESNIQPLSEGASMKSASVSGIQSAEVQEPAVLVDSFTKSQLQEIPAGFTAAELPAAELPLFEEYFYGAWSAGDFTVMLGWGADSAFGSDYECTGIEVTDDGCYMGAYDGSAYDLWFVPASDMETLYIYRNVTLNDGVVQHTENGIACESTDMLTGSAASEEYSALGYFGRIKLADDMGMTADMLFNKTQLETYEGSGSGAEVWTRSESYEPIWDKVVLKSQADSVVEMSMAFTNSAGTIQYFDLGWTASDDGSWYLYSVEKSMDVFARTADDLKVTLTMSDLDIFENYYFGTWTSDSGDITLNYSQDIFGNGTYCGGFYAGTDGWSMYSYCGDKVQVYYIDYSDPFTMFLYEPDQFGYAKQGGYICEYTHGDYGSVEYDTSAISWLGLQRWILDTWSATDHNSLSQAVYSAIKDTRNDYWSDEYGKDELFEGYVINRISENKYQFMFQQFSADGESRWVTMVLSFQDNEWSVLPADGITESVSG